MEETGLRTQRNVGSRCSDRFVGILLAKTEDTLNFAAGSEEVNVLRGQDLSFADQVQQGEQYWLEFNAGGSRIIQIFTVKGDLIWAA